MAITVTRPVDAPTGLSATLQSGGSLDPNTTYYYVVVAYMELYLAPTDYNTHNYHSDLSAEGSFTTTTTELSALIKWNNVTNGNYYEIFITKVSGDYTDSFSQECLLQTMGDITDGATGYLVTSESGSVYVCHTAQYDGTLPGGISKDLGIIKVNLTGSDSHDIDEVYSNIVSAGFGDYAYYDGNYFVLKGWITTDLGSDTVSFGDTAKCMIFIKGGMHNRSSGSVWTFGSWDSVNNIAVQNSGCVIDFLNARYPFRTVYEGTLNVWGCTVLSNRWDHFLSLSGGRLGGYYIGGSQQYQAGWVDGFNDTIWGTSFRGISGILKDTTFGQGNNFNNYPYVRCKCYQPANMPYYAGGSFYKVEFTDPSEDLHFYASSHVGNGYYTDMYDCVFAFDNGEINYGDFYYVNVLAIYGLVSDAYVDVHYSVKLRVVDSQGDPIVGATVSAINQLGNQGEWTEHDGTLDRLSTGNTFTTPRTTDANGEIDFYLKSYRISHNPTNTEEGNSFNIIKTEEFPLTITFSKDGYEPYTVIIDRLNEPYTGIVALNDVEDVLDGGLTNAYETESVRHLFLNEAIPKIGDTGGLQPSAADGSLYVALLTASPGEAGSIANEADYGGYARVPVPRGSAGWTELNGQIYNFGQINFPEVVDNPNTVTYFAVMKEATGSDMIAYSQLVEGKTFNPTDQPQFGPMALNFKIG